MVAVRKTGDHSYEVVYIVFETVGQKVVVVKEITLLMSPSRRVKRC